MLKTIFFFYMIMLKTLTYINVLILGLHWILAQQIFFFSKDHFNIFVIEYLLMYNYYTVSIFCVV